MMRLLISLTFTLLLAFGPAQAQTDTLFVLDTTNSGIPSNLVTALKFDKDGSLWVGTSDAGIGCYSKTTGWAYYNVSNTPGMLSNHISDIQQHPNGDMWFGTPGRGVLKKSGSTWTAYDTATIERRGPDIRYTQTYIRFDSNGNTYTKAKYLYKYDGSAWTVFDDLTVLKDSGTYNNDFKFDSQDRLWCQEMCLHNGTWTQKITLPDNHTFMSGGMDIDQNDNVYVAAFCAIDGDKCFVTKYDEGVDTTLHFYSRGGNAVLFRWNSYKNELWIVMSDDIFRYTEPVSKLIIKHDFIYRRRAIEFDAKGNVWIGLHTSETYYKQEIEHGGIIIYNENGVDLGDFPIGIKPSPEILPAFSLYPNPANNAVTIEINKNIAGAFVNIVDLQGKVVKMQKMTSSEFTLNTAELPAGIYLVELRDVNEKLLHSERLVRQ